MLVFASWLLTEHAVETGLRRRCLALRYLFCGLLGLYYGLLCRAFELCGRLTPLASHENGTRADAGKDYCLTLTVALSLAARPARHASGLVD